MANWRGHLIALAVINGGTRNLGARGIDYFVEPIQVDTYDTEDVWVAI